MKRGALTAVTLLLLFGCEREERRFQEIAPGSQFARSVQVSGLQAGGPDFRRPDDKGPYDDNAYAVNEGQRLYNWFNCVGCHAHGGGSIGPALMDDRWIYGSAAQNIFSSIVEGRPNGMPSFRGKIPNQQVWQLVAYVRSLGRLNRVDARTAREEHLSAADPARETDAAR